MTVTVPSESPVRRIAGLVSMLAVRNFRIRYRRSVLGALWVLIQPAIQALVFTLLFTRIVKIDAGPDYLPFLLAGVFPWAYFGQGLGAATSSIVDNGDVVRRIAGPRYIYPLAAVAATALTFAPITLLLVAVSASTGHLGRDIALLVPAVLIQTGLSLGLGLSAAALYVDARDVRSAIESALFLGFYLTPVIYDLNHASASIQRLLRLNPLTGVLSLYRAGILGRPVDMTAIVVSVLATVASLGIGIVVFRSRSRYFADSV